MDFDAQDEEIVQLLTRLKRTEGEYPSHLLSARRQQYVQRIAEIPLGVVSNNGAKNPVERSPTTTPSPAPAASTLLETILVVAIIVEASAVTYFYRDKLAGLVQRVTGMPRVHEVTQPPVSGSPAISESLTPSPVMTSTALSPTVSEIPAGTSVVISSTPVPAFAEENLVTDPEVQSTPALNSNESGNSGNNGNHYGQTPKPERTIENNGNNDSPNHNPPPRDNSNSPPNQNRNEPRPTKSR